jgi:hypothetical protein
MDDDGTDASTTDAAVEAVRGLKHLKRLLPLFASLHEVGCGRDTAGNRLLHFDRYAALVMLYLFNPLIGSMRALQRTLGLPHVAKALGVGRFSLGAFSEAPQAFDPAALRAVVDGLAAGARPLPLADPRLADLKKALTLVDGTMLAALPKLAQAAAEGTHYGTNRDGTRRYAWRLHAHVELSLPQAPRFEVTGGDRRGANGEAATLRRRVEAGRCYVTDAAYWDQALFDDVVDAGSNFVCRIRENAAFDVLEERGLSAEALAAGIVRDAVVRPGGGVARPVRVLMVEVTPRKLRTRAAPGVTMGQRTSDVLLIATDMLDLAAELVALIYRQRYAVELFFRFLKGMLGLRHLLSQRKAGVEIQTYCVIIACLLISAATGRKPDKATAEIMGWYLLGVATEQDVIDHLNRPDNRGVKLRAKDELWKKLGV